MSPIAIFFLCVAVGAVGYWIGSLDGYIDGHARGFREGEQTARSYLTRPAATYAAPTHQVPTADWLAANPGVKSYEVFHGIRQRMV